MARFWRRIAQFWHEFRNRRKYGAAIRPDSIRAQEEDLGHLAELAGRSGALAEAESRHLAQLGREMRSLALMTRQTSFCSIPADKRRDLYESLAQARAKLLDSMQKASLASEKTQ